MHACRRLPDEKHVLTWSAKQAHGSILQRPPACHECSIASGYRLPAVMNQFVHHVHDFLFLSVSGITYSLLLYDHVLAGQAPSMFTGSDVRIRDPDMPKLHFALAFKGAAWTDPDAVPLMVIQSLIGAWNKNGMAGARADLALPKQAHP